MSYYEDYDRNRYSGGGPPSTSSHSRSGHTGDTESSSKALYVNLYLDVLKAYEHSNVTKESDDRLHDAGPIMRRVGPDRRIVESRRFVGYNLFSCRGVLNGMAIVILVSALLLTFLGLPMYTYYTKPSQATFGAAGPGGINATGQIPDIPGFRGLIDKDTPASAMKFTGHNGKPMQLVFSDEFNTDGRTFYPGEDPYWEAVDLHYWATGDLEWYDPGQITTKDGYLEISLTKEALADSHNLGFLGGMLQGWNKFCFTGGHVELGLSLPGNDKVAGLWPAAWAVGNLGRAGYGASLEGMWPYSYDECDIGTLPNQTDPRDNGPPGLKTMGDPANHMTVSYMPGQRLSACTCKGEDHPGPWLDEGRYRGRSAPEIDIVEAQVSVPTRGRTIAHGSQSAQWAPFNLNYYADLNANTFSITNPGTSDDPGTTSVNTYKGGAWQQVTSCVTATDSSDYNSTTEFTKWSVEYQPSYWNGYGTGELTWGYRGEASWTMKDKAMAANSTARVGNRPVSGEPMYLIFNLGMSEGFGDVDLDHLVFPAKMRIDYVRVYQEPDHINVGCDPELFPTADYIASRPEIYMNPNLTVYNDWENSQFPKSSLTSGCGS